MPVSGAVGSREPVRAQLDKLDYRYRKRRLPPGLTLLDMGCAVGARWAPATGVIAGRLRCDGTIFTLSVTEVGRAGIRA